MLAPCKKSYEQPRQHIKKQRHYFADKGPSSQSYGFSSSHSCMDVRVGPWRRLSAENGCFLSAVLEKTLESPLDSREIKPVNTKGGQPWLFIGKTDAEAEAPILWPTDAKGQLIGKDYDAGKDWRQEKGLTEDEMVGWRDGLQWTWIWANSGGQGRAGKPVVLHSVGLQGLSDLVSERWPCCYVAFWKFKF